HTRSYGDWSSDVCSSDLESISQADMFDMEYWSLEQAKLGAARELPLAGQIAVITGAAGAIGAAIAHVFAAAGAEVALLDLDEHRSEERRVGKEWRGWWAR